nr:hypothetical protein [Stackebrandtia albiflava]
MIGTDGRQSLDRDVEPGLLRDLPYDRLCGVFAVFDAATRQHPRPCLVGQRPADPHQQDGAVSFGVGVRGDPLDPAGYRVSRHGRAASV